MITNLNYVFFPKFRKINAIDASNHKALSDALASMFAPDIYDKVTSEFTESELTNAW
jgi:hypothetical protein